MKTKVFSVDIDVSAEAIDAMGHVNNLVYLQWCLDAAEAHWKKVAPPTIQNRYIWYVLEHQIQYKHSSFEGDQLRVTTWVTTAKGVRSERRYRISRIPDDKTIVEAHTLWCLLDANTQKPCQITEEIRTLFQ